MEAPRHGTIVEAFAERDGRLAAFGNQLIDIHIWLREELARLREEVDAYLDDRAGRPRELPAHCLAFCSALRRHHGGEDAGAFPVLAERFPELRPVLEELERDHHVVAETLRRLEELLADLELARTGGVEPRRVHGELDGLAALLEVHFTYEERKLVTALDALDPGVGTAEGLLGR